MMKNISSKENYYQIPKFIESPDPKLLPKIITI